jgi:hypothetical protein
VTDRLFDVSDLLALFIEFEKRIAESEEFWGRSPEQDVCAYRNSPCDSRSCEPHRVPGIGFEKTTDVSRFLGTWVGDKKANAKVFQDGLIPSEQGLKISISAPSDSLVVTSTFRCPPVTAADPWINGTSLSYKLEGSTSPANLNGVSATTRLSKEGDVLVLTVLPTPTRAGGAGARPTLPPAGNVLQTMAMSVDGDRLKVEWNRDGFRSSLSYDRQK